MAWSFTRYIRESPTEAKVRVSPETSAATTVVPIPPYCGPLSLIWKTRRLASRSAVRIRLAS